MSEFGSMADFSEVMVGHATESGALTGCTAVVFPEGAVAGAVSLGVASGARELQAFSPRHLVQRVHGVCLCGGSAFGLAACDGVMRRLEQAGIGHKTSSGRVPIVGGAVVYDLNLGDGSVRPDQAMGFQAAENALAGAPAESGNVGAGAGTCAGKLMGVRCATKTGLGHGMAAGDEGLQAAALAVVNPVGDVLKPGGAGILAGARRSPSSPHLKGSADLVRSGSHSAPLNHNTTLCVVAVNARLSRVEACWAAEQAAVALARTIDPPFTRHDGDVIFCASVGERKADLHRVGLLCRDALMAALVDACLAAEPAGGLPNCSGLKQP